MLTFAFLSLSLAQELPFEDTRKESGMIFIARLQQRQPSLVIGKQQLQLLDDGKAPDKHPGDGVFAVFVETSEDIENKIQILDQQKKVIWSGQVPSPPPDQQTWVWIDDEGQAQQPKVTVENRHVVSPEQQTTVMSIDKKHQYLVYRFLIAVLFFVLGWVLRSPFKAGFSRLVYSTDKYQGDYPNPLKKQQIWSYNAQDKDVVKRVVTAIQPYASILLQTTKPRRQSYQENLAHLGGVYVMNEEQADSMRLLQNLRHLQQTSPTLLLIDGLDSLPEQHSTEAEHSMLQELLLESAYSILVLVADDQPLGALSVAFQLAPDKQK